MPRPNQVLLTAEESKGTDARLREELGIPTLVLMENAGRAVAIEALKVLKKKSGRTAVFCGRGNNGGDGFVAARHLLANDIAPDIFLAGSIADVQNEARTNLEILLKLRQKVAEINSENIRSVIGRVSRCSLVIDALLGVGLSGEVKGIFKDLIDLINSSKAYVLSVDIPSGLDATTGEILGACVKADRTVTFMAKKRGMVLGDGPKVCGEIIVRDLGIPLKNWR